MRSGLAGLIGLALLMASCAEEKPTREDLEAQVEELQGEVVSLKAQLDDVREKAAAVDTSSSDLESAVGRWMTRTGETRCPM